MRAILSHTFVLGAQPILSLHLGTQKSDENIRHFFVKIDSD